MVVLTKSNKYYTYDEYLTFPDEERWEIIYGEAYMAPAPNIEHQDFSRIIGNILVNYVDGNNLGKVYYAPTDVILSNDTIVQPDLLFISKDRLDIITKKKYSRAA